MTDAQLRSVIRTGKGLMPAFGGLMGDEDLTNVIAFIRTLPPGARAPQPSATPPSALIVPPQAPEKNGVMQ
jgi:mono/diheme cytochrome c family protein